MSKIEKTTSSREKEREKSKRCEYEEEKQRRRRNNEKKRCDKEGKEKGDEREKEREKTSVRQRGQSRKDIRKNDERTENAEVREDARECRTIRGSRNRIFDELRWRIETSNHPRPREKEREGVYDDGTMPEDNNRTGPRAENDQHFENASPGECEVSGIKDFFDSHYS